MSTGDTLPDFELIDHAGNRRRLSELVGGDPTVLQFYRGWWCPKEQAFFARLVRLQDEAEVAYSRFVSVSVDPPAVSAAFRAGLGRALDLSLPTRAVRSKQRLGLLRNHRHAQQSLRSCASFVLYPDLRIHSDYNGYWFWGRPTEQELAADLRAISREVRLDWDAPTP